MRLELEDFERICDAVEVQGESREALRHLWVDGRTYAETWRLTGIKTGALRTLASRAKQRIQTHHQQMQRPAPPLPDHEDNMGLLPEGVTRGMRSYAAELRDAMRLGPSNPRTPTYRIVIPARGSQSATAETCRAHGEILCLEDMSDLLARRLDTEWHGPLTATCRRA